MYHGNSKIVARFDMGWAVLICIRNLQTYRQTDGQTHSSHYNIDGSKMLKSCVSSQWGFVNSDRKQIGQKYSNILHINGGFQLVDLNITEFKSRLFQKVFFSKFEKKNSIYLKIFKKCFERKILYDKLKN